jgi:hypothetical protein
VVPLLKHTSVVVMLMLLWSGIGSSDALRICTQEELSHTTSVITPY